MNSEQRGRRFGRKPKTGSTPYEIWEAKQPISPISAEAYYAELAWKEATIQAENNQEAPIVGIHLRSLLQASEKKISDLNTLLDLAEAALKRCYDHSPCSDPDCCSTAIANEAARVNAGETCAAIKAGRKMIEAE